MFRKKTKKADAMVRFQHQSFTRRLDTARQYRRLPDRGDSIKWSSGKLIFWLVLLFVLIYLIYFPNFLYIKRINIAGIADSQTQSVREEIATYFRQNQLTAQQNRIFFSKNKLSSYLSHSDPNVLKLSSARVHWLNRTLDVVVVPRAETYVLQTDSALATVYNDGSVARLIVPGSPVPGGLLPIKLASAAVPESGQNYFDASLLSFLDTVRRELPAQVQLDIDHLEIPVNQDPSQLQIPLPLQPLDIDVFSKSGFEIILDTRLDLNEQLKHLQALLKQLPPDQQKKLFYVDLRFKDLGYLCFVRTACSTSNSPASPVGNSAPSAPPAPPGANPAPPPSSPSSPAK